MQQPFNRCKLLPHTCVKRSAVGAAVHAKAPIPSERRRCVQECWRRAGTWVAKLDTLQANVNMRLCPGCQNLTDMRVNTKHATCTTGDPWAALQMSTVRLTAAGIPAR